MLVSVATAARLEGMEGAVLSVVETIMDAFPDLFPTLSMASTSNLYSVDAFNFSAT